MNRVINVTVATISAVLIFASSAFAHYGDYNTQYNVTQNAAFNRCLAISPGWCPAGFHLESHGVYSTHSRFFVWSWYSNAAGEADPCLYTFRIDHDGTIFTQFPGTSC